MQNPFVWHDLCTTDVEAAKAFYAAVVGWTFTPQPPAYSVANVGGLGMGGIMAMPPDVKGMPPFWAGYIYTPDVDETCDKAVQLGGTICREPWDIPGVIRMAVLADPTGATFNIMQPLVQEDRPCLQQARPARWAGTTPCRRPRQGLGLLCKLFGWSKGVTMDMGPAGQYTNSSRSTARMQVA